LPDPPLFDQVPPDTGTRTARSTARTPRMNAIMQRWTGGRRREPLDHTPI
jgi:putative transposase